MFEWYLIAMLYIMVFIYVRAALEISKTKAAFVPLMAIVLPVVALWVIWDTYQEKKFYKGQKEVVFDEDLH